MRFKINPGIQKLYRYRQCFIFGAGSVSFWPPGSGSVHFLHGSGSRFVFRSGLSYLLKKGNSMSKIIKQLFRKLATSRIRNTAWRGTIRSRINQPPGRVAGHNCSGFPNHTGWYGTGGTFFRLPNKWVVLYETINQSNFSQSPSPEEHFPLSA
jgi:hypothetical protein